MIHSTKQHTLKSEITFKGVGLHTGKMCTLTIQPAEAHHGYKFQRTDLEGQPIVKACTKKCDFYI